MDVFGDDAGDVSGLNFLNSATEALEKVRWIAVELVGHALTQDFVRRVEVKDERVQQGILGALDLVVVDRIGLQLVEFLIECLNGFDCALALCAHRHPNNADRKSTRLNS